MTASLLAVSCGNGLGHVKRQVVILERLFDGWPSVVAELWCEGWQLDALRSWDRLATIRERGVAIRPVGLPIRWSAHHEAFGPWLTTWHRDLDANAIADADLLWSDNLVEPLAYRDGPAIMSGSFLWHDILRTAHPSSHDIGGYAAWCEEVLSTRGPSIMAPTTFAMPAVINTLDVVDIGLTPLERVRDVERSATWIAATGSSPAAGEVRVELEHVADAIASSGRRLRTAWSADAADRWDPGEGFAGAEAVVGRAGIGTIADAVAARTPILFLPDRNPEIAHNEGRLVELGIGAPFDPTTRAELLEGMRDAMAHVAADGATLAASELATRLGR